MTGRLQRASAFREVERPILVLGCPRSGTTLLSVMLHAHPRLAVAPETRFLPEVYRARLSFGDLRAAESRAAVAAAILDTRGTRVRDLGVDRAALRAAITAGPPALGAAFATVFAAYAGRFGKPRWGEKRPAYYRLVPALCRLFPDAQFVHVIRDGRDCVASLLRMSWYRSGPLAAVATWTEAMDYGRSWRDRLGPDRWHEVQYEALVADPEPTLLRLCGFLEEEYDPAMVQPREVAALVVPARKTHHRRVGEPVDAARVGAWRAELPEDLARLLTRVGGDRLRERGYPVPAQRRPSRSQLAEYARVAMVRRATHRREWLQDAARDLVRPQQVPAPAESLRPAYVDLDSAHLDSANLNSAEVDRTGVDSTSIGQRAPRA